MTADGPLRALVRRREPHVAGHVADTLERRRRECAEPRFMLG